MFFVFIPRIVIDVRVKDDNGNGYGLWVQKDSNAEVIRAGNDCMMRNLYCSRLRNKMPPI